MASPIETPTRSRDALFGLRRLWRSMPCWYRWLHDSSPAGTGEHSMMTVAGGLDLDPAGGAGGSSASTAEVGLAQYLRGIGAEPRRIARWNPTRSVKRNVAVIGAVITATLRSSPPLRPAPGRTCLGQCSMPHVPDISTAERGIVHKQARPAWLRAGRQTTGSVRC